VDPLSGRLVAVAPGRSRRPGAATAVLEPEAPDERESCPFCEGREEQTPPEVFALPAGREPDTPGWSVRVVPNKFPAFERQEVVVHAPDHLRSSAEVGEGQLELVAEAWRTRAAALRGDGFETVFAGINEGRAAGSSLPHSHSQLVGFRERPSRAHDACRLCDYVTWERLEQERIVLERDGFVLLCPFASRAPYECLVAPLEHERDGFESGLLGSALELAAEALRRLRAAEGARPANLWLQQDGHWCLELVPRLTVFAALELASGRFVNPLAPEDAAETLRGAL
jgi:UDPglucose--hexose-1-phosphate uridylyltransferase